MVNPPRIIPFSPAAPAPRGPMLRDIRLTRAQSALLDGLSLEVSPTGVTALLGPNGAGKSLLLRLLAGLLPPDEGEVLLPPAMVGRVGLVLQRPVLLRRSVRGNLLHALKLARVPRAGRPDRLQALLAMGQLEELAERPARSLSGGEQQRLSLVRALAANPLLLMLDEPTAHLDPQATHAVEQIIARIAAEGRKLILVSHDLGQVGRLADEVAFLHKGRAIERSSKTAFLHHPQSTEARAYLTGKLLL